jgi:hypothetical protein
MTQTNTEQFDDIIAPATQTDSADEDEETVENNQHNTKIANSQDV